MNTCYRIVWSKTLNAWIVASEMAKGRKKGSSAAKLVLLAVLAAAGGVRTAHAGNVCLVDGTWTTTPTASGSQALACGEGTVASGTYALALGFNANASANSASALGYLANATGEVSTAVGSSASAAGYGATGVGTEANASGGWSTAVGFGASATQETAVSVGYWSVADGTASVALGYDSHASGTGSLAMGPWTTVTSGSTGASALGYHSTADGAWTVALGGYANAVSLGSIAVGTSSSATGERSLAMGYASNATGQFSSAVGWKASAMGVDSIAMGNSATASVDTAIAIGAQSAASASNAVALGNGSVADQANTISVGNTTTLRRIVNLDAGIDDTDGVNVSQLRGVTTTIGGGSTVNADGSINAPTIIVNNGQTFNNVTDAIENIDGRTTQNTTDINNLGDQIDNIYNTGTKYFHANSTGADSMATGQDAVAIGMGAVANNANDVALGAGSKAEAAASTSGTTIGGNTYGFAGANPTSTVSVGDVGAERTITNVAAGRLSASSTDAVNGSQLFATNQQVTQNSTDISNINTQINNGEIGLVQQDATSRNITVAKDTDGSVVDVTGTSGTRTITGVTAGAVSTTSVDAVNGSQLYGVSQSVSEVIGGGSTVNNDGSITAPTIHVDGTTINNVTDAIENIDGRTAQNTTDIANLGDQVNNVYDTGTKYFHANSTGADSQATGADSVAIGMGAVANNASDVALGAGSVTTTAVATPDGTINGTTYSYAGGVPSSVISVGSAGQERQLTNVAAGQVTSASTDAVNGSQLYASNQAIESISTQTGQLAQDALQWDPSANGGFGAYNANHGGAGPNIIVNVAPGVAGTDAVNMNQLNALQSQVTNIDGRVTNIENNSSSGGKIPYIDGNAGGSSAANANAGDTAGVAVGYNAQATGDEASALGQNATALGLYGTAAGNDSYASGDYDTAIGGKAKVYADGSVAVGANATVGASATNAVAIGADSTVNAASGTAIGQGANVQSSATNAVALGQGSVADRANTVSVGSSGQERQITNVQAGVQQTDAVNVSQLTGVTSALGGGSSIDNNGNVMAPSYRVGGNTYNNVGDALSNLDSRLNDDFSQVNNKINQASRQANRGIAAASAMVNATPYMPGRTMLNAGMASYRGETALGVGVSRWNQSGRVNFNAGISAARNDQPVFRVGVGMVLGD